MRKIQSVLWTVIIMLGASLFVNATPRTSFITPHGVSVSLPPASLDFSDLDVRDRNNRKISSVAARRQLENLFEAGLNTLLIHNLTPARRLVLEQLAITWNRFPEWLTNSVSQVYNDISSWIQERKIHSNLAAAIWTHRTDDSNARHWRVASQRLSFQFLVNNIISSTVLLR